MYTMILQENSFNYLRRWKQVLYKWKFILKIKHFLYKKKFCSIFTTGKNGKYFYLLIFFEYNVSYFEQFFFNDILF